MREKTGSVLPTDSGTWRVLVTIQGKRKSASGFKTWEEADEERRALLKIATDELPDGITVGEWIEKRLERREIGKEVRDPGSDWSRFNTHLKDDPVSKVALTKVRRRHVLAFVRRMQAKGLAVQSVRNTIHILSGAFRDAIDEEILEANPAIGIRLSSEKRTEEEWHYLTPPEQVRLLSAIEPPLRWIVQFAMGTGLRAGELVTLRLADVHKDRVIVRYGSAPDIHTKGGRIREVPLFGMALEAVKQQLKLRPTPNPKKLLFPAPAGGFRSEEHVIPWKTWKGGTFNEWCGSGKKVKRTYKGVLDLASIRHDFRWHDLRHTCGTSLVSGWWGRKWSLEEVKEMLGHADIRTTQRYAKLVSDALREAAKGTRSIDPEVIRAEKAKLAQLSKTKGAPPAGIGPATNGLGSEWNDLIVSHRYSDSDQFKINRAKPRHEPTRIDLILATGSIGETID